MRRIVKSAMAPMRVGVWLSLALGLAACQMAMGDAPDAVARAPRSVTLPQSGISIAGPNGFCVDPGSLREGAEGAFVLLANCGGLNGRSNPGQSRRSAMLTLSVSETITDREHFDTPSLEAYFQSETGRRALSRAGRAETVGLIESDPQEEILLLHARDRAPGALPGQGEEYWRALFLLQGHLVTATALPFAEDPMPEAQLRQLLDRFVSGVRRRNPSGA